MILSNSEKMLERVKRLMMRLNLKEGKGTAWSFVLENGETHYDEMTGLKPPEEFQDDIESTFVWLWSLKDHVKKYSVAKGYSSQWVETKINADKNLCICADLANGAKHDGLDRKRNNRNHYCPVKLSNKFNWLDIVDLSVLYMSPVSN